MKSIKQY